MSEFKISHTKGTNLVTVHADHYDGDTVGSFSYEAGEDQVTFNAKAQAEVKAAMEENEISRVGMSLQITPAAYAQVNEKVRIMEEEFSQATDVAGNQVVPGRSSVENSTQVEPVESQTIQSEDTHKSADLEVPEGKE